MFLWKLFSFLTEFTKVEILYCHNVYKTLFEPCFVRDFEDKLSACGPDKFDEVMHLTVIRFTVDEGSDVLRVLVK